MIDCVSRIAGTFGFIVLGCLLVPFHWIPVSPPFAENASGVLEDLPDAIKQMENNYWIIVSVFGMTNIMSRLTCTK